MKRKKLWIAFWFISAFSGIYYQLILPLIIDGSDWSGSVGLPTIWWIYTTIMSTLVLTKILQNQSVLTIQEAARPGS